MQSAAKLGVSITISSVGSDPPSNRTPTVSSIDRTKDWQPAFPLEEDALLHQLRANLVQALDNSNCKLIHRVYEYLIHRVMKQDLCTSFDVVLRMISVRSPFSNLQQSPQQNTMVPIIQECVNAITEHQRLQSLMKGEWVKGLLPQSSVRAEYMVQRIRGIHFVLTCQYSSYAEPKNKLPYYT